MIWIFLFKPLVVVLVLQAALLGPQTHFLPVLPQRLFWLQSMRTWLHLHNASKAHQVEAVVDVVGEEEVVEAVVGEDEEDGKGQ